MLPFAVHPSVRAEFSRRWSRARPMLLVGVVLPPVLSVALGVFGSHFPVGWVLVLAGLFPLLWLVLRRTGWWGTVVGFSGAFQALGVGFLRLDFVGPLAVVVAVAVSVWLVVAAQRVLMDPAGGVLAATDLEVRSTSRSVRSSAGRLVLAYARFDATTLKWEMSPGDPLGGSLPLRDITGVWPAGEVVVVRTPYREAHMLVGNPPEFAALLDQRLRLLTEPGWLR